MANTKLWKVDPSHTEVQFKVKHLVISTVTASFKCFSGEVHSNGNDFDGAEVSFSIDAKSIDTNVTDRDNHLRSDDFFAVEKYPTIDFKNGVLHKTSDDEYTLDGDLVIKDISKPVELKVEHGGIAKDPWGAVKAGFEITGKVNRKDFNLTWNAATEAGGFLVGDDVRLFINIQLVEG
jgi:polyisoprenoid-binding protein YceI